MSDCPISDRVPVQCRYDGTPHGRCWRPTLRADQYCYYHKPETLAKRKPRRLSRKKLEALVEQLTQEIDGLKWEKLRLGEAYDDLKAEGARLTKLTADLKADFEKRIKRGRKT